MSANNYYNQGAAPQYPQQSYGPPQGNYNQQYAPQPQGQQMYYGPPQGQGQYAPQQQQPRKEGKQKGFLAACLATLCCCCVCEEGCECCFEICDCFC